MMRTYALLNVSEATFNEIKQKLKETGYDHAVNNNGKIIDMHGFALEIED